MRRGVVPLLGVLASLALAGPAEGKLLVREAELCGASGCTSVRAGIDDRRGLELLGPVYGGLRWQDGGSVMASRPVVGAPSNRASAERYRVTLTLDHPRRQAVLDVYPQLGEARLVGDRGGWGGAVLKRGWVELEPGEAAAYEQLASGVEPYGSADPASGGQAASNAVDSPWTVLGPAVACAWAAAMLALLVRRRPSRA